MPRVPLRDTFPVDQERRRVHLQQAMYQGPQEGQDAARTLQILPWWDFKPPQGQDFLSIEKAETLAAVAGTTLNPLGNCVFQLPAESVAVVKLVTIFIDNPTLATDVDWTLRINDGPVAGWDNLTTFPRVATNVSIDFSGTVLVPSGALLSVSVRNNAATGPWIVGAMITGWYLSESDLRRIYGQLAKGY